MSCLDSKNMSPTPTQGPSASSTNVSMGISRLWVGSAKVKELSVAALMTEIAETRTMYTAALTSMTLDELIGK